MTKTTRRANLALLLVVPLAALALARAHASPPRSPRRVVFYVGDGMGLSQVALGRIAAERAKRPYAFDRFRTIGLQSTTSSDCPVTDSAAAATALSSGFKTKNGAIGVDEEKRARRTILEVAREAGFATGLVTTTRITHATPAGFAAHVPDRDEEDAIAEQYVAARSCDVLMGGGLRYFGKERQDALRGAGYSIVTDARSLRDLPGETRRVAGLFAESHMAYEIDRDPAREPSLREMTERAIACLDAAGASWFLMVEGGRIDHACHVHDAAAMIPDQLAFADAIDAGLERVEREGDLLVLVSADHATGGLAISERIDLAGLLAVKTSAERLAAERPEDFTASLEAFRKYVEPAYGFSPTEADLAFARKGKGDWARVTPVGHLVSLRLGVGFYDLDFQQDRQTKTHGHDGTLVPVFAAGAGAESFAGVYENTRVPRELARLLGLAEPGKLVGEKKKFR